MKLSDFTSPKSIELELAPGTKRDVMASVVRLISKLKGVSDGEEFLRDVLEREELVTTGVGYGVAFPHAKSEAVRDVCFAFARTTEGVDFDALDSNPVRLIFLIGAPKNTEPSRVYLNLMARLSFLMKDEGNREALLTAGSAADVLDILDSVR